MQSKASVLSTLNILIAEGGESYIFLYVVQVTDLLRIKMVPFWMNETAGREIFHNRNIDKVLCLTDNTEYGIEVMGATFWTKCWRGSL